MGNFEYENLDVTESYSLSLCGKITVGVYFLIPASITFLVFYLTNDWLSAMISVLIWGALFNIIFKQFTGVEFKWEIHIAKELINKQSIWLRIFYAVLACLINISVFTAWFIWIAKPNFAMLMFQLPSLLSEVWKAIWISSCFVIWAFFISTFQEIYFGLFLNKLCNGSVWGLLGGILAYFLEGFAMAYFTISDVSWRLIGSSLLAIYWIIFWHFYKINSIGYFTTIAIKIGCWLGIAIFLGQVFYGTFDFPIPKVLAQFSPDNIFNRLTMPNYKQQQKINDNKQKNGHP